MRANATMQKMTKLDKPIALVSEWGAQLSAEIKATRIAVQMAFRTCMVGAPGSRHNMPNQFG
jgi:hypothetical protein